MPKKLSKNRQEIDGRIDDEKRARLNEILNMGPTHSYGNISAAKYEETLEEMNLADLHNEAINRGLPAHQSRNILIKNLVREFRVQTSAYKNYSSELGTFSPSQQKKLEKLMK